MLRIMTFNANGIRSAADKGFFDWFGTMNVDILCMQELKAQFSDIPPELRALPGYEAHFHCAQTKRGYSGCGFWSRIAPQSVSLGFGDREFDAEGRCVEADFGKIVVISAYFPSGTSGDERQQAKYRFLDRFLEHLNAIKATGKEIVLCGDFNIAHKEIDIKNWRGNLKHSGFLPEERQWMTDLFEKQGFVDVFRQLDPRPERYTWWSQRGQARAKNVGWRIDYEVATSGVAKLAVAADIKPQPKWSDHAPLWIDYCLSL